MHLDALLRAGSEEIPHLRRHDVEGVSDEKSRFPERGHFQQRRYDIGQARIVGVAFPTATLGVVFRPRGEGFGVFVSRKAPRISHCDIRDAPLVREPPGFAAVRSGARHGEEQLAPLARTDRDLPQLLFLRAGKQQRKLCGDIGVQRLLVDALHEGAER